MKTWLALVLSGALISGALGYSAARTDDSETVRLRKQVQVLKDLIVRYQEELAYVDELNEKLGKETSCNPTR